MADTPSNLTSSVHKAPIADLCESHPEIETKGFWAAIKALPDAEYIQELMDDDPRWVADNRFVPDAWVIDTEARAVILFEVVSTHDVPRDKILKMIHLMWALDQDEYDLFLIRHDMTGSRAYDLQGTHHDKHRYVAAGSTPSKLHGHPTVKPYAVMDKIMRNVAGETVCDPFMGTGSTGVAAIRAGKRFFGIEQNERHFATAINRISRAAAGKDER